MPASAPILTDLEALLAPIPGDEPAGPRVPFEINSKLEDSRKDVSPEDDPDGRGRSADWRGIVRQTQEILAEQSKDLLTAARLTEGLTKTNSLPGLRDGLKLMHRLITDCWDRLNPTIEDGDLEVRAGPFNWLDAPERGARFPNTIRLLPLFDGPAGSYSYVDWKNAQEGRGSVSTSDWDEAVRRASYEKCETLSADIDECVAELTSLTQALADRIGADAPGMIYLRGALEDVRQLVGRIKTDKTPLEGESSSSAETGTSDSAEGGSEAPMVGGRMVLPSAGATNREDAYRLLSHAASMLRKLEPHSPVPWLVERAIHLGKLEFPQLIRELLRENAALGELYREFGIKGEDAGAGGYESAPSE